MSPQSYALWDPNVRSLTHTGGLDRVCGKGNGSDCVSLSLWHNYITTKYKGLDRHRPGNHFN